MYELTETVDRDLAGLLEQGYEVTFTKIKDCYYGCYVLAPGHPDLSEALDILRHVGTGAGRDGEGDTPVLALRAAMPL